MNMPEFYAETGPRSSRKVFTTSRSETQHAMEHHFGVNSGKLS